MMGPSKRIGHRSSKSKVKDGDVPVKNYEVIDLISIREERNKSNPSRLRTKKGKEVNKGTGKFVGLQEGASLQSGITDNEKAKSTLSKMTVSPEHTSSISKTNDPKKDKDDSILDEDLLADSQFNSQENLLLDSSQDGDQCEVRWDYTSPETMKQLKKMRGKYSAQDVKRIIANFPDVPIKPIPATVHQFKYTFATKSADVLPLPEKNKVHKAKQRAAKRMQQRERCKGAVEDMLLILHQHQRKQEKAGEASGSLEVCAESSATAGQTLDKDDSFERGLNRNFAEDDLFQDDNSFLIEATQNLEGLLPVVSKENAMEQSANVKSNLCVGTSEAQDSCDLFSSVLANSSSEHSFSSKSVIPSSCVGTLGKKLFHANPVHKVVPHPASNMETKNSCFNHPTSSKLPNGTKLNDGAWKQQSTNQQIKLQGSGVNSSQKTFRRHHTFQHKDSSKGPRKVPSLHSPFRKCLSFDDSFSPDRRNNGADNGKEVSRNEQKLSHNMSFDSSLSDDFLLQATEVFDSKWDQAIGNAPTTACNNDKASFKGAPPNSVIKNPGISDAMSKLLPKDNNDTLVSPIRLLKQDSSVQRIQKSKSSSSPMQSFFKKTFAVDNPNQQPGKHKAQPGPNSTSTPVKVAKMPAREEGEDTLLRTDKGLDSFMADDSFMDDEALFESQILPMLELAETQVTEKEIKIPCNQVKYSPDEIEKKRLAALQKLRKNDIVPPPQSKSDCIPLPLQTKPRDASPEIIEQTQITSSPRKCSQEEINRKKEAAQRKLMAKTNSTGSIQSSQTNAKNGRDPLINNNKVGGNEIKYSQEAIKQKREEALKKRRLKLMQVPSRKS